MGQDLGAGKGLVQLRLDLVGDHMRPGKRQLGGEHHVQLDEDLRAGAPGAEVVHRQDGRMAPDDGLDVLAHVFRQLAVHQHVEGGERDPRRADQHVSCDRDAADRVDPGEAEPLGQRQRGQHAAVHQQVAGIVQPVGADRDRAGAAHDIGLEPDQREGRDQGEGHDPHADRCVHDRVGMGIQKVSGRL